MTRFLSCKKLHTLRGNEKRKRLTSDTHPLIARGKNTKENSVWYCIDGKK